MIGFLLTRTKNEKEKTSSSSKTQWIIADIQQYQGKWECHEISYNCHFYVHLVSGYGASYFWWRYFVGCFLFLWSWINYYNEIEEQQNVLHDILYTFCNCAA